MRMATADGVRLDLASTYARMGTGETSEVPVFVTDRNKGQGRIARRLFSARVIIVGQHEEASARAIRVAKLQCRQKRVGMALQPMTLASSRFLIVLTSFPAERATAAEALAACRLCWRVELAFKRLKSGLGIDRLMASDPAMARSWLLSHLILALLIDDGARGIAVCVPRWRLQAVRHHRPAAGRQLIARHICDPPRRRASQAVLARSHAPLAPLPLNLYRFASPPRVEVDLPVSASPKKLDEQGGCDFRLFDGWKVTAVSNYIKRRSRREAMDFA